MFVDNSGNMRVLVVNPNSTTDKTYIWSQTGNQGSGWQMATTDIGQLSAGYKVQNGETVLHKHGFKLLYDQTL